MRSLTQLLVGMAAAGVAAGPQRPTALVAGAVAGVLPDMIDWWQRQVFRQPDITVTPDPLAPDPAVMATGVRIALGRVGITGQTCMVRFNPIPAPDAGFVAYQLDCDRHHRLVVALESRGKPVPVDTPNAHADASGALTPHHPLPLRIGGTPVDLRFARAGRRIESRDLDQATGIGHALPLAGVLAAVAMAGSFWIGLAGAAAWLAHWLLDLGGRHEVAPWLPFSNRAWHGRRQWDERSGCANLCAGFLAGALLAAVVLAGK